MSESIKYLSSHQQISDVLAEGFAQIYHDKPQFPITFLAQYLKNHEQLKYQKKELIRKLVNNQTLATSLKKQEEKRNKENQAHQQKQKHHRQREQGFQFRIKQSENHEDILNQFCQWIQKERNFTGVYIGELQNQTKKFDLIKEDSEQAHVDNESPKVVRFKAASNSHNQLIIGKMLPQQSVVGRLFSEKAQEGGEEGQQGKEKEKPKPKGEVYIQQVQENKELTFFKYPRLGSFYAVVMRVKSYLYEKIFDANIVKTEVYKKTKEEYDKQLEERESKFRALYDERTASGADQKELQELEQNYQKEEQAFPKPKEEEFQFILREFVICFDTFGLDRQINDQDRDYCKRYVQILRQNWQNKQKELLRKDIGDQLKLLIQNVQIPMQQALNRLIEQEDKELPSNEQVEKNKANQKLAQLQMNTLRIEKLKEYVGEEKNLTYLQHLLDRRVIKYAEIMKLFLIFAGFKKEEINYKGTNVMNWIKARKLLSKDLFVQKINQFISRGSKPTTEVQPYAKWQRILRSLEKYELNTIASFNIYLGFILRFLQLSGRVRIADNQARKAAAKVQRQARQERIKEVEQKLIQKEEKLQAAKAEAEAKEEALDQQAWLRTYEQENMPIDVGDEVVQLPDLDLEQELQAQPQ